MRLLAVILLLIPATLSSSWIPTWRDHEEDRLTEIIVKKFKKSEQEVRSVVRRALWIERYEQSPGKFPGAVDILAVISVESGFNSNAIHPIGPSVGLMQINSGAHKVSVSELKKPEVNMRRGYSLLALLRSKTGSDSQALVAYNAGQGKLKQICGGRQNCETPYVLKVSRAKQDLSIKESY